MTTGAITAIPFPAATNFITADFHPLSNFTTMTIYPLPLFSLHIDKMLESSPMPSNNSIFARMDFYRASGHLYFDQMTFTPAKRRLPLTQWKI
jgi:hypothetical protein